MKVKLNQNLCAGIQDVFIDVSEGVVLVDSVLKTSEVQALLESTGFLVFFKGFGGTGADGEVFWLNRKFTLMIMPRAVSGSSHSQGSR